MPLFISEIYGPANPEEFTSRFMELSGMFREHGIAAAGWIEQDADNKNIIQGWIPDDESRPAVHTIQAVFESIGWGGTITRVFSAVRGGGIFPGGPGSTMLTYCNMPHNWHGIEASQKTTSCSAGHVFSNDHNIANCVRCGNPLI